MIHPRPAAVDSSTHLRVLDGLRGVAILLVVLPHLALSYGMPAFPRVERAVEALGHGVDIFFVLSGFCLALPILRELRSGRPATLPLAMFYFNRAYRIVPMYYLATVLCLCFDRLYVAAGHALPPSLALPNSLWSALAPFLFLDRGFDPVNANFWSIPVQLRWYAIFPAAIVLYAFSRRLFWAAVVGAWIAYLATRLHAVDVGALPLFMLGIVAADLHVLAHPWRRFAIWLLPVAMLLGHLGDRWASMPDPRGNDILWTMQPTTLGWQLAAFCFVVAATSNGPLRAVLQSRPFTALGVASFSIYLIHTPVIEGWRAAFGPSSGIGAAAAALLIGALAWRLVERPLSDANLRRRVRASVVPLLNSMLQAAPVSFNLYDGAAPRVATRMVSTPIEPLQPEPAIS